MFKYLKLKTRIRELEAEVKQRKYRDSIYKKRCLRLHKELTGLKQDHRNAIEGVEEWPADGQ